MLNGPPAKTLHPFKIAADSNRAHHLRTMRGIVLSAVLIAVGAATPVLAQTEPSPVPTSMPEGSEASPVPTASAATELDPEAAKKALGSISYKDCGKGGPGKILVTFKPDGTVERVVLAEGTWEPNVAVCVTRRFMEATVPAFEGASRTVKWSVALEGAAAAPGATYAPPPPPPGYAPYPMRYGGPDVIPADDGPAPPGYHREERARTGSLVTGTIITSMGLIFGIMSLEESSGSSSGTSSLQLVTLVHFAIGVPLFIVGLTKKKVFVADHATVSLAPTITKNSATFGLSVRF